MSRAHDAHQAGPRIVVVEAQVERMARRVGQGVPPLVATQQAGAELLGAFGRRVGVRYPEVEVDLLRTSLVRPVGRPASGDRR
jgi:hypothetical protein